ncbi:MAG: glycosyltransferase [Promethearchaeota archaeon]
MKIAIISPLPPEKPGESIYTARLIKALAKNSKIEIIAISGKSSKPLNVAEGHVETASIWENRSLLYPFKLWRFIRKRAVRLVHVQYGPHGEVYGGFFGEVMLFLFLLLKYTGVKTTVTLHSTWMTEQAERRIAETKGFSAFTSLTPAIFRMFMKLLDLGTNTIQLSTTRLDSTLKRRFLREFKCDPNKVLEIPHACTEVMMDITKEEAMNQLGITDKKVVLVFGYIRRDKGIDLAMHTIKTLRETVPDVLLLVAGRPFDEDGEKYLQELQELQKEWRLSGNVRFDVEYIPEEKIPVYFSAASIILAPYSESIGASGPLHAACAYGNPIVASDAGIHIKEALGGNVLTFRHNDPDELCEKLKDVLTNKELAQKVHYNLIQYSELESWDTAAKRTLEYYRKTLGIEGVQSK